MSDKAIIIRIGANDAVEKVDRVGDIKEITMLTAGQLLILQPLLDRISALEAVVGVKFTKVDSALQAIKQSIEAMLEEAKAEGSAPIEPIEQDKARQDE